MTETKKIERLKEEIQRLREKTNSLQDENTALKTALEDRDRKIAELEKNMEQRTELWEKHLTETAEAIEEAAEAKLEFEQALAQTNVLRREMDQALRAIRKLLK